MYDNYHWLLAAMKNMQFYKFNVITNFNWKITTFM